MRSLAVFALALALAGPVAVAAALSARTGNPETRLPGWEAAGFTAPFSYENTRCYDACAEQIARLKAEEVAAKKRAEEEAAAKAAAARRRAKTNATVRANRRIAPRVRVRREYYVVCPRCGASTNVPLMFGMCSACAVIEFGDY